MPLGVLAQLPDIRGAAIAKYRSQASAQLGQVERAVDDSEAAAQQLRCVGVLQPNAASRETMMPAAMNIRT